MAIDLVQNVSSLINKAIQTLTDSAVRTMNYRVISIIVLGLAMIGLYTSQVSCQVNLTRHFDPENCIIEGTVATLTCTVEDRNNGFGATIISGSQVIFDCPSVNTATNNRLYLRHLHAQSAVAFCEDFVSSQIVEVENGIYTAQINITTTIAMNGGYVECSVQGIQDRQQIQLANIKGLMPCILKTSNSTRVKIYSTNGDIPRGIEVVPHNTALNFSCDVNCTPDQNYTRCANGTFQPSISHILQDGCHCRDDSQYIYVWSVAAALGFVILMVVLLIIAGCRCWRKDNTFTVKVPGESKASGHENSFELTSTGASE